MGPSSSNTAAPFRIGSLVWQLIEPIEKTLTPLLLEIKLAASTSYARTFLGMKSDLAFINGFLENPCATPDFTNAYQNAEKEGFKLSFDTSSWMGTGTMKVSNILVKSKKGEIINIIADSTGGGTVAILEIDGCPLELCGDFFEVLIFYNKKTGVEI